jgi:hypothetical protein
MRKIEESGQFKKDFKREARGQNAAKEFPPHAVRAHRQTNLATNHGYKRIVLYPGLAWTTYFEGEAKWHKSSTPTFRR